MEKRKVLLIDYRGSEISAEIPFLFRKAGYEVYVFCFPFSWLTKNSYYSQKICKNFQDKDDFLSSLKCEIDRICPDLVVPCDDTTLRLLNENLEKFSLPQSVLPLSSLAHRNIIGSKIGLAEALLETDILQPDFLVLSVKEKIEKDSFGLSFPVLIKLDESSGGKGVYYAGSFEELEKKVNDLKKNHASMLLQEYIQGDNIAVECLFREGKLLTFSYSKVIETVGGEFGVSTKRLYLNLPCIEETLLEIGEKMFLHGFASMTFIKEDKTEKHFLVEIDTRPQAWFRIAKKAGVDFVLPLKHFFNTHEVGMEKMFTKEPVTLFHFRRSFFEALRNRKISEILSWVLGREGRWSSIPFYDPKLLLWTFASILKLCLRKD